MEFFCARNARLPRRGKFVIDARAAHAHVAGITAREQALLTNDTGEEKSGCYKCEQRRGALRNVALEIHALMQDADDIDAAGNETIKQNVGAAGDFPVALTDL
jgi:hypothetical protein